MLKERASKLNKFSIYFTHNPMGNSRNMSAQQILLKAGMFHLGGKLHHPKVTAKCVRQFQAWRTTTDLDRNNPIVPDLQYHVYIFRQCAASI